MTTSAPIIELRTSPHLHAKRSVSMIMRNVVYALLPICAYSVWVFGISALALILTTTCACVGIEHLFAKLSGRPSTITDGSAVITGILLALILPPGFPLWMAIIGSFIAIGMGKLLFGGLGFNVFNPALVGRAFLQAAYPVAITAYTPAVANNRFAEFIPSTFSIPFVKGSSLAAWSARVQIDGFSGATPLMLQKFEHVTTSLTRLLWGQVAGSTGETCGILIAVCGLYLMLRRMMDWRIPVSMLLSAFLLSAAFFLASPTHYPPPTFVLFSGGLILGAMFMATDMVGSPVTPLGVWIYGAIMGVITVMIRLHGGLSEGVMYAILLGNALSPMIDNLTQPRPYGALRKAKAV